MNSSTIMARAVLVSAVLGVSALSAQAQGKDGTVDSHYDNHSREGGSSPATYPSTGGVSTETRTYGNGPTEDSRSTGAGASGGGGSGMGTDATGAAGIGNSSDAVDMRSGSFSGSDTPPPADKAGSRPGMRQSGSDATGSPAAPQRDARPERQKAEEDKGAAPAGNR